MPVELEPIWTRVREELRRDVPDFKFLIWLEPLTLAAVHERTLYVHAPEHMRSWVRDRYLSILRAAAGRGFRPDALVEIVSSDWEAGPAQAHGAAGSSEQMGLLRLRPKYTFEEFVIGDSNHLAHAAALRVAECPGQTYNPLFIHGQPGVGKTHLLHAIGNYVSRFGSGLSVRYATLEQFTTAFVHAVRAREMEAFKQSFRSVDVLLLDDVQFLTDKTRTEEELFHTFNVLHESGRQLVMTSDRSPEALAGLEERLGDRFASGLVATLEPPNRSVRRAILEKRARLDTVEVDPDLLEEIADIVTTSVRALEAALIQVVAHASLHNEAATPALARRLLARPGSDPRSDPCTVATIIDATATAFGVPRDTLAARDRRPPVARARKVAMYLARELLGHSLPEIGRAFGRRDHTTVLSAIRGVARELERDPNLALAVNNLRERLQPRI